MLKDECDDEKAVLDATLQQAQERASHAEAQNAAAQEMSMLLQTALDREREQLHKLQSEQLDCNHSKETVKALQLSVTESEARRLQVRIDLPYPDPNHGCITDKNEWRLRTS